MKRRGLIVGKFYPPHRGHKFLIDAGRAQADELHVIICQKPGEQPAGELRAAWLREIHPDVRMMLIDDIYDEQDSQIWAINSRQWLGFTPDVVFTSEDYGERFAFYLGCEHVQVDKARLAVPVSGTKVRAAPFTYWDYLEQPVRAWYVKRVCLVGAESTGKTTLAQQLAEHYQTVWVPEYGRTFTEQVCAVSMDYDWSCADFEYIARMQCEQENAAARLANKVLICDTDAFATAIWHQRYMNERSEEVEAIANQQPRPAMYLLPDVNTPFVQDGFRDGEKIRQWMHDTFIAELTAQQRPFHILTGSFDERFTQAVTHIDTLLLTNNR